MNIILGILGLIVSTYIGYIYSKKYTDRKKFYKDFFYFNKNFYNQVSFSQNSLIKVIREKDDNSYFNTLLKEIIINNNENIKLSDNLLKEDEDFFKEYVYNIGKSDYDTQKKYLSEMDSIILKKMTEAEENEKKYKKVYLKLGITIGLIILIILI